MRLGLSLAGLAIVLDQLTKWWILAVVMDPPRVIPVLSIFNIVLVHNRGASFGLLNRDSAWVPWLLTTVAVAVVVVLLVWLYRAQGQRLAAGIGLIIGGALGNVIDRLRFGAVVDFLDFHLGGYHWPAFNVADSAITIGVAILLIDALIGGPDGRKVLEENNKDGT